MIEVTEYDPLTGRLGCRLGFSDEPGWLLNQNPDLGYLDGHHDGAHYYADVAADPPVAALRQAQATTRTGLILDGYPVPCTLWIDGDSYPLTAAGPLELEFPLPGTYALRIEAFPYLDWTDALEITV